jgi:hypothetical protein
MPILADFTLCRYEDGSLVVSLAPGTNIGGWSMRFALQHRFGGISGIIEKWMASGYYGVSGMNINNSGQGVFNIGVNSADTSGLDFGNYAYTVERLDSGFRTILTEGYLQLTPSTLP